MANAAKLNVGSRDNRRSPVSVVSAEAGVADSLQLLHRVARTASRSWVPFQARNQAAGTVAPPHCRKVNWTKFRFNRGLARRTINARSINLNPTRAAKLPAF